MTGFATHDDWARFLRPVAAAVRNPPTAADFKGRCGALAFTLRVDPQDLTDDRARDLCRKAEFWPSVAEIEEIFADVWKDRARSRAIATAGGNPLLPAPPVKREAPTEAEREAVRLAAAKFRAEMDARVAVRSLETRKPVPLKPHDLLAAYEAAAASGNHAAAYRAARLRGALGA